MQKTGIDCCGRKKPFALLINIKVIKLFFFFILTIFKVRHIKSSDIAVE